MTKDGERAAILIEKIAAGGAGLGRLGGRVVFVPFTIPGEEVTIRTTEEKKDYLRAVPLAILKPSPSRVRPVCPHFTVCGGCDFQHMPYDLQLEVKRTLFLDAFRRIAGMEIPSPEIVPSSPYGYRSRVQIHVSETGTGFKEAEGARIVPVASCPVASPEVNSFLAAAASGGVKTTRCRIAVFGWGGRLFREDGEEPAKVVLCGKEFSFAAGCFFQSNPPMMEKLISFVLSAMPGGETVLDLYGGVGTFAAFLSEKYERVVLVERNAGAVPWAALNLKGLSAEVFPGSVEVWLRTKAARTAPEAVIVDPPRTGLSAEAANSLGRLRPRLLVYVSCDAATLARDARKLEAIGFLPRRYRLFDFYPQTAHVESVCFFERD